MDHLEFDAELDRVRERAERNRRRRIPVALGVGVALVAVIVFAIPDGPERHPSTATGIVDATLSLAFLVAMVMVFVRFRRQQVSFWRQPSLVLGLDPRRRRQVMRDLRRGDPSSDPMLLAIEQIEVERLRGIRTFTRWSTPVLIVALSYWGSREVADGDAHGYIGLSTAALMAIAAVWSVPYHRGTRAFD